MTSLRKVFALRLRLCDLLAVCDDPVRKDENVIVFNPEHKKVH